MTISSIAENLGASEAALRLLITILIGYPLALLHRKYLYGKDVNIQHAFFIFCGVSLGYWNYGFGILHCIYAVIFTYLVIAFVGANQASVFIVFIFNMTYLLTGYWTTSSDEYDILWTMPFCVLTLRLIGLSFDVYDSFGKSNVGIDKKYNLISKPTILEIMGFSFFPSSFLVGPQYPLRRYLDFVHINFDYDKRISPDERPNCIGYSVRRLGFGLLYLLIYQIGNIYYNDSYFFSEEYKNSLCIKKMWIMAMWGRITLYKYISCWLLTEGSCILYGLTHDGKDNNNKDVWTGCENVKLFVFENSTLFNHYIMSFNINTNHWVAKYIYKRLKFLNNKMISQLSTLLFLAVWHGLHSGYYVSFFMEFAVMIFEKDLESQLKKYPAAIKFFNQPTLRPIVYLILRLYTFVFMGYCLIPFSMLNYTKYMYVYQSVYYAGFVLFVPWMFVYKPIVKTLLKSIFNDNESRNENLVSRVDETNVTSDRHNKVE